ncbi:hypothetical protein SAMN05660964_01446 [Thiothrix caldifontis]|uniref:Uncharacterized protein n=1 Tax=Thiothrix caldifontis TaxID=525918 RepID=A0A1H4APM6_9GAMM|nr:hypothetical protein [Thiothrix caldifontis]SEA37889.1 hypothetical protein SAMN05660964_01446 [Thiothrix caldifontis]
MFTLVREIYTHRLLLEQTVSFSSAFLIAESFYKFGSFGLELFAFLATWFAIDAVIQFIRYLVKPDKHSST